LTSRQLGEARGILNEDDYVRTGISLQSNGFVMDGFDGADLAGRILRRRLLRLGRQWKDESGQERQACCYSGYPRYSLKSNIHAINVDFVNTVMLPETLRTTV